MNELFSDDPPRFFEKGPYSFFDQHEIKILLEDAGFQNITLDTVPFSIKINSLDDVVNGIIDGTPLTAYIAERNAPTEAIKQKLRGVLDASYGATMELPMQALVYTAKK